MRLFAICAALPCLAAFSQTPEQVLVAVNANSSASGEIGSYYVRARHIPSANVCVIRCPTAETIDRAGFDAQIAAPIAACLRTRRLTERILYIVTTLGVPLRVRGTLALDGDNAAVDSELALLYAKLHGRVFALKGPSPNPFFSHRDATFRHPDFPIYLVTRLAAYDVRGAKALVDRSLRASNRGKFVIDCKTSQEQGGDGWLRSAAVLLPSARTVLDASPKVLEGIRDVIAYASWGSNDPARKRRTTGFSWLPGGIVTEYVSTNARTFERPPPTWNISSWKTPGLFFAASPQTLVADYLEEGATGAAGHIDEPYLAFTPRPDYLLPAWYSGRTLAESYYLSIPAVSWQNVVIGDPLCTLGPPGK